MSNLRWRIWLVAVLGHGMGMFHRAAMAPVADRVMADYGLSATLFGALGAVYFYIYAAMQLPSGTLADTLGPRKTLTGGLVVAGIGSLVMGSAPSFEVLLVGRVLVGFGVSVLWLSVIRLIMSWFELRQLATISGLSGSAVNLWQIVATTPLAVLVVAIGWKMSFVGIGVITLCLALASWLVVRDSPIRGTAARPDALASRSDYSRKASVPRSLAKDLKAVATNRDLWPLLLANFGTYGAYLTFMNNWAVVYFMQSYGLAREVATNFILVATIGMIVGLPLAGWFSDRWAGRRRRPAIVFASITTVAFLSMTLWNGGRPPIEAQYFLSLLTGFGIGIMPIALASMAECTPTHTRGIASGFINMGGFVGAALAQPLFGYLLDLGWTGGVSEGARLYPVEAFQMGLFLCCALAVVGLIGAALVKETQPNGEASPKDPSKRLRDFRAEDDATV